MKNLFKEIYLLLHKTTHWEYWPFSVLYFPVYFVWMYFAFRSGKWFFFLPSNPSIKNAGFLLESKKEIYDIIPGEFIPKTLLITPGTPMYLLREIMKDAAIYFPCIVKPDTGMKGLAVVLVENENDLEKYAEKISTNFLIQEFISLPNEMGIFYYRFPNEKKGSISGIVKKEFLKLTGDGESKLEILLQKDPRHHLQLKTLQKIYGSELQQVLSKGETKTLVPFGNHARGALFTDVTYWADETLIKFIDNVCQQIPGFYFGRLDIRYNTLEELKQGKNFSIIELNGAGSEPTHIYDPNHSVFFAWKEIIRHLNLLYLISNKNYKQGNPHMSFHTGLLMLKENKKLVKSLKHFIQLYYENYSSSSDLSQKSFSKTTFV
jgi:hypothetical protein